MVRPVTDPTIDGNPFVWPPAGHDAIGSDHFEDIAFNQPNRNVLGIAKAGSVLCNDIEDRLEVGW